MIGDSVPCRLSLEVNGTPTDADSTPTIDVWDSAGTKQVTAESMSHESTGEYVYHAATTGWPVGRCFYAISYVYSTVTHLKQSMFFMYDQTTWMVIEKVKDNLDSLQEGELASATIYQHYQTATRKITPLASTAADADLLEDAIIDLTSLWCYVSYLADRERAGDQANTAAFFMLGELRTKYEESLANVRRFTIGPGEVLKGVIGRTATSAMQYDDYGKKMDRVNQVVGNDST